jgi:hypothetical protein
MIQVDRWPKGKQMAFAIRDDDLSYFSSAKMIDMVYSHAISLGFIVTFAAIPEHKATNNLNVPPERRGEGNRYRIDHNQELISRIKFGLVQGQFDIAQHGLSHTERMDLAPLRFDREGRRLVNMDGSVPDLADYSEFKGLPAADVKEHIIRGRNILNQAFGLKVGAFVAPQEYASSAIFRTLVDQGMHYCGGIRNRAVPSLRTIHPDPIRMAKLILHRGQGADLAPDLAGLGDLAIVPASFRHYWSRYTDPVMAENSLNKFRELLTRKRTEMGHFVLLTHLWEYFYDWEGGVTQNIQREYLDRQLDIVAEQDDVWRCGLNELTDWVYRRSRVVVREKSDRYVITAERGISGLHIGCRRLDHDVCQAVVTDEGEEGLVVNISPGGRLMIRK